MASALDHKVGDFIERVVHGPYVPGAGSVEALVASSAAALLIAAADINLSKARARGTPLAQELSFVIAEVRSHVDWLKLAIQRDIEEFGLVGRLRDGRDSLTRHSPEWRDLNTQALLQLRKCTPALLELSERALRIAELAIWLLRESVWWVHGDLHTAANLSIASAEGSVAVIRLNTYTLRTLDVGWCRSVIGDADEIESFARNLRRRLRRLPVRRYPG